mmetsp:Transcript_22327/g.71974  ORF Transcript_22327/g.71974 Transcript_22327/m.71974 type:complete len:262 (+) Transcript_22327:592-1377(+)
MSAKVVRKTATCQSLVLGSDAKDGDDDDDEARRDADLNARDQDTTFTHASICRQPKAVPGFPTSSYAKIDVPPELKERLWRFYRSNARTVEDYPPRSTGINVHLVNTTMVNFDFDRTERDIIASQYIQPLVEEWANQGELVHTSFYGVREYHRGHELRMHVDRVATHVFSVIINLHQEEVDEPWPLDVIDFDGSKKSVFLDPGQMLFYQSAKLVHGRPRPFNGSLYVNCFCHFKPQDWPYEYGLGDILYHNGTPLVDYKVD